MRTIEVSLRDYWLILVTSLSYTALFLFIILKSSTTDFVITLDFNSYKESVVEIIITLELLFVSINMLANSRFHRIRKVTK